MTLYKCECGEVEKEISKCAFDNEKEALAYLEKKQNLLDENENVKKIADYIDLSGITFMEYMKKK